MSEVAKKRRVRLVLIVAAVVLIAAVLAFRAARKTEADAYVLRPIDLNYTILANCTVDYPRPLDMTFLIGGVVKSVEVADGQRVSEGQVLVQLDDFEARRNLAIRADGLRSADLKLRDARDEVVPSLRGRLQETEATQNQPQPAIA